jgi:hypothetical protein
MGLHLSALGTSVSLSNQHNNELTSVSFTFFMKQTNKVYIHFWDNRYTYIRTYT